MVFTSIIVVQYPIITTIYYTIVVVYYLKKSFFLYVQITYNEDFLSNFRCYQTI